MTNGRTMVVAALVGGAVALSFGLAAQPANRQADEVMSRLDRLEKAVLKPESALPEDPDRSIEQMLEDVLAATGRIETQIGLLDDAKLDELSRRVRVIYDSLLNVKIARLVDIEIRLRDMERQFERLGPAGRLEDVVRQIDDLERQVQIDMQRASDDNRRAIDDATRELRRLDTRLTRVEAKIK
jgi:hypothetical protein